MAAVVVVAIDRAHVLRIVSKHASDAASSTYTDFGVVGWSIVDTNAEGCGRILLRIGAMRMDDSRDSGADRWQQISGAHRWQQI
jgi:hypothetical protein